MTFLHALLVIESKRNAKSRFIWPTDYFIKSTRLLIGYNHSTPRSVTMASSSNGMRNFLPPHSGIGVNAKNSMENKLLGFTT